jgi:hypothetical protein
MRKGRIAGLIVPNAGGKHGPSGGHVPKVIRLYQAVLLLLIIIIWILVFLLVSGAVR